jgi:hypothetical protein
MMIIPVVCNDPEVQAFIEEEMLIGPYSVPEFQKTPDELIEAAVERFGNRRCEDIAIWIH